MREIYYLYNIVVVKDVDSFYDFLQNACGEVGSEAIFFLIFFTDDFE